MVTPVDILRRAGCVVVIAGLDGADPCAGRCGVMVTPDAALASVDADGFDLLLIPGGPGVAVLRADGRAAALARGFSATGRHVAAICAAPLVLHDAGLLDGLEFTAHHSTADELPGALGERVVVDGRIITSRGAGTAVDFALTLAGTLAGADVAEEIKAAIMA